MTKSFSHLSVDEKIAVAETRIKNSLATPEIMTLLGNLNVQEDYLNESMSLVDAARNTSNIQKKEYGEQYTATKQKDAKLDDVEVMYQKTEEIAGVVLANADFNTALKIGIPLPTRTAAKVERMRSFYAGAIADSKLLPLLTRFNKGIEVLEAEKQEVETLASLVQKLQKEKGEAQVATKKRDEAVEVMTHRHRELTTLLKVALGKRNDLLEIVGVFVRG